MRKVLVFILVVVILSACGCEFIKKMPETPVEEVVHLYAEPEAVPQSILEAFTAQTGIKVKCYKLTDLERAHRKIATGVSPFDLVLADNVTLERMAEADLLQTIDMQKLSNAGLIKPGAKTLLAPYAQDKIMPYSRTCAVLVHDVARTLTPVIAYSSLWGYGFANAVNVPADARLMSAVALKARAYSVNTAVETQLKETRESLCALKNNTFSNVSKTPHLDVAAGQGALTVAWAKDAQDAKNANPNLEVLYPAEGAIIKLTGFALPKSAPHTQNAYELLNFLLRGENNAAISMNLQEESLHTQIADYTGESYTNMLAVHMAGKYVSGVECLQYTGLQDTYNSIWEDYLKASEETDDL